MMAAAAWWFQREHVRHLRLVELHDSMVMIAWWSYMIAHREQLIRAADIRREEGGGAHP
jgi:hypothetical protein